LDEKTKEMVDFFIEGVKKPHPPPPKDIEDSIEILRDQGCTTVMISFLGTSPHAKPVLLNEQVVINFK